MIDTEDADRQLRDAPRGTMATCKNRSCNDSVAIDGFRNWEKAGVTNLEGVFSLSWMAWVAYLFDGRRWLGYLVLLS